MYKCCIISDVFLFQSIFQFSRNLQSLRSRLIDWHHDWFGLCRFSSGFGNSATKSQIISKELLFFTLLFSFFIHFFYLAFHFLNFNRNSNIQTSNCPSSSSQLWWPPQIYLCIHTLEKWQLKVMKKCRNVYLNQTGFNVQLIYKSISFWWFRTLRNHFIIMVLDLPFWTWKHLQK